MKQTESLSRWERRIINIKVFHLNIVFITEKMLAFGLTAFSLLLLQFGQFNFSDTIDLEVTFNLDLHKRHADGKLHDLTTYIIVKYNGSLDTCSSFSGSREFTFDGPATTSITYYVPRKLEDTSSFKGRVFSAGYRQRPLQNFLSSICRIILWPAARNDGW